MTSENTSCRMSIPYSEGMRKCVSRVACDYAYPFGGEKFCALEWSYRIPEDMGIRRSDDLATHVDYILSQEAEIRPKFEGRVSEETLSVISDNDRTMSLQDKPQLPDTKLGSCRQPIPLDLPLKDKLEELEDRRHPPVM